jgi:polar amino acid transport system substrate-binding protein
MKRTTHFAVFLLFLLCFLPIAAVHGQQTLTLNTPGSPPYHYPDQTGILDLWMQDAFARIGITVNLEWLPPERSLLNANTGISDGEAIRIAGLSEKYANLIQIPEKVHDCEFVAFSKINIPINGWDSLAPYDVGIIRGHKICELNIKNSLSLTKVDNTELLFLLLKNNRADVVVVERIFGMAMLTQLGLHDVAMLEPPLATQEFFLYLHNKHEDIAPRIARAIKEMKNDGTRERIYREGIRNPIP